MIILPTKEQVLDLLDDLWFEIAELKHEACTGLMYDPDSEADTLQLEEEYNELCRFAACYAGVTADTKLFHDIPL